MAAPICMIGSIFLQPWAINLTAKKSVREFQEAQALPMPAGDLVLSSFSGHENNTRTWPPCFAKFLMATPMGFSEAVLFSDYYGNFQMNLHLQGRRFWNFPLTLESLILLDGSGQLA